MREEGAVERYRIQLNKRKKKIKTKEKLFWVKIRSLQKSLMKMKILLMAFDGKSFYPSAMVNNEQYFPRIELGYL